MNCHSLIIILHIYLTFYFTYSFLHPCKEVHCIKFMSLMHYRQESNDRVFMTAICLFENSIYLHNVPSSYLLPTPSLQLPHILLNFIVCLFWKRNSLSPIKVCGYLNNMKSVENIVQVPQPLYICVFHGQTMFWEHNAITKNFLSYYTDACISMFTETLFMVSRKCNQPRYYQLRNW